MHPVDKSSTSNGRVETEAKQQAGGSMPSFRTERYQFVSYQLECRQVCAAVLISTDGGVAHGLLLCVLGKLGADAEGHSHLRGAFLRQWETMHTAPVSYEVRLRQKEA